MTPADHPSRETARPAPRAAADVEVTIVLHAHADGRQIVVRRREEATSADDGRPQVHIDAVVR